MFSFAQRDQLITKLLEARRFVIEDEFCFPAFMKPALWSQLEFETTIRMLSINLALMYSLFHLQAFTCSFQG